MLLSCLPQLVQTSSATLTLKVHSLSDLNLCLLLIPD